MVPNPHSSSSTLPYYFAVGYSSSTSGWHILWHDPQGKPLSGAASAPQRSDGPAALPYHSPAGAPYVQAQMKMNFKKGGGGFTIFPPPPAWKSSSIFSTVNIPPGSYFTAFLFGSSSSPQWLLLFLFLHLWSPTDRPRQHLLISQMPSAPQHNYCRWLLSVGTARQWWLRAVP